MENKKPPKALIISFYLEINGVLEINKLIELVKSTGLKITKEELLKYLKKEKYIIKENLIYLNETAIILDENLDLQNLKKDNPYKEYTLEEIIETLVDIEQQNYETKIKEIIKSQIKDKQKLSNISAIIYDIARIGYYPEENIKDMLESENINLTNQEQIRLENIINEIYYCTPTWELNGYRKIDLDDECEDGEFEDLSLEEKAIVYVHIYSSLNGAIEINKVIDIINKEHNIKLTNKEINTIVKDSEIISQKGKYLYMNELGEEYIEELINHKIMKEQHKIIDDIDKITEDFYKTADQLIEVCFKYNLGEEILDELLRIIHIGTFNKKILQEILKLENIKIKFKEQEKLLKELEKIQHNTRKWILNGYKESEII